MINRVIQYMFLSCLMVVMWTGGGGGDTAGVVLVMMWWWAGPGPRDGDVSARRGAGVVTVSVPGWQP